MSDLALLSERTIPAMTTGNIDRARTLEAALLRMPQCLVETDHVLHGGQYTRTVMIPAGAVITGALIKVATTLVVSGDCTAYIGDRSIRLTGYQVIAASAGRKQAFIAHTDTWLTMTFPTKAETIEQAEDEFTDEAHLLISRCEAGVNTVTITRGKQCLE